MSYTIEQPNLKSSNEVKKWWKIDKLQDSYCVCKKTGCLVTTISHLFLVMRQNLIILTRSNSCKTETKTVL